MKKLFCYCFLDLQNEIWTTLNELAAVMAKLNLEVNLFCPQQSDSLVLNLRLSPFFLSSYKDSFNRHSDIDLYFAQIHSYLLEVDQAFGGDDSTLVGLTGCFSYWRNILLSEKPSLVLNWGSTAVISQVVKCLCERFGIMCLTIERGFFNRTIMIEPIAPGARSILNFWPFSKLSKCETNEVILSSTSEMKYSSKPLTDIESIFLNKKFNVLLLGDHHSGAGLFPTSSPFAKLNQGRHSSSEAILMRLKDVQNYFDFHIVFQPHPFDLKEYDHHASQRLIITRNLDALSLIENCDLLCVGQSTVQFMAMEIGKPVFLFCNSISANKGIAVEIKDFDDLIKEIQCLFKHGPNESILNRAKEFCSLMRHEFLFSYVGSRDARPFEEFTSFLAMMLDQVPDDLGPLDQLYNQSIVANVSQYDSSDSSGSFRFNSISNVPSGNLIDLEHSEVESKLPLEFWGTSDLLMLIDKYRRFLSRKNRHLLRFRKLANKFVLDNEEIQKQRIAMEKQNVALEMKISSLELQLTNGDARISELESTLLKIVQNKRWAIANKLFHLSDEKVDLTASDLKQKKTPVK